MIEQLRVRLPNKPGALARMVSALAEAKVDMKALDVSDRDTAMRLVETVAGSVLTFPGFEKPLRMLRDFRVALRAKLLA